MSRQRKRKREKEKEKTFGKGRDLFCGGEDKQRRKRRKIIGKNIFRRRKRKRRKILGEGKYIFFVEETDKRKNCCTWVDGI